MRAGSQPAPEHGQNSGGIPGQERARVEHEPGENAAAEQAASIGFGLDVFSIVEEEPVETLFQSAPDKVFTDPAAA
jgi:hypothetical protein